MVLLFESVSFQRDLNLFLTRFAGQEGGGGGAYRQTLHTNQPGPRERHGYPLPQHQWSTALPQPVRVSDTRSLMIVSLNCLVLYSCPSFLRQV